MIPKLGLARGGAAIAALLVGGACVWSARAVERDLAKDLETATSLGLDDPVLAAELRRAESAPRAHLRLARALLASALGDPDDGALDGSAIPEHLRRLETAGRLARSVLDAHPASWEAAMVAGAATYLGWSETRDPRLLQEYRSWERPLLYALDTAPDRSVPARYLSAAYLELWPALSDEKRKLTRDLLADAFQDRATFARLLDPWLAVAGGAGAYGPIPDRSWAWAALRGRAGRRSDWEAYCDAWRRERRALSRELRENLRVAHGLSAGGELGEARKTLLGLLNAAPVDLRFAGSVERAMELLPHGPQNGAPSEPAIRWLAWAMERDLTGGAQPLSAASLARLRRLAFPRGSGSGEGPLAAWVELAADRLERAERIEVEGMGSWQERWAPYFVLKARFLADKGRPEEAREALGEVRTDWHDHPAYARIAARLATHAVPAGTAGGPGVSRPATLPGPREVAAPLDWSYSGATARLPLSLPVPADGLLIALSEIPARGDALAIQWDGEVVACRPLSPGSRRLELAVAATPGLHEMELAALAGGRIYGGTVELPPPRPGG